MHSLICLKPGELAYRGMDFPIPKPGELILKMTHLGICGTDLHAYEGNQPFFNYPRILGHELAAVVEDSCGNKEFKHGEAVTIIPYFQCGKCIVCRKGKTNCCVSLQVFGVHIDGGMKEYISVHASALVKSSGLTGEQLALTEPLAIGAHGVRRAEIKENETVLVIGAGPIGLGTIAMAKLAGAQVIAMDISPSRLSFAKGFCKADAVINPISENPLEKLMEMTKGDMPDVIIDATGNRNAINQGFSYISHGGRYVLIGLQKEEIVFSHPEFHKREATLMSSRNATREDFDFVISCIREKRIDPLHFITNRVAFNDLAKEFPGWIGTGNNVIKAMVIM